MTVVIIVALLLFGLILGSFANALVWRFHAQDEVRDELEELRQQKAATKRDKRIAALEAQLPMLSMSRGRSMCSKCRHPLAPEDLVPLFSWLSLGGKCRYCRQAIEDTPWLEALLPAAFVLSYILWPLELVDYGLVAFVFWLVFLVCFAALTLYDVRWFLLPDRIVWPLVGLAAVQVGLHAIVFDGGWPVVLHALWGIAAASGIFWLLYRLSDGRWIGGGDVKLGLVLGLLVGGPLEGLGLIFLASLFGTFASLPQLLRGKLGRASVIPFGPFLMLAACVIVLFAQRIGDYFGSYFLYM